MMQSMYVPNPQVTRRYPKALNGFTDDIIKAALPEYRRIALQKDNQEKLRKLGQQIGKGIVTKVRSAVGTQVANIGKPPEPMKPTWLNDAITPIVAPLTEGIKSEVIPGLVQPAANYAIGAALAVAFFGGVIGFAIGRRSK